MMKGQLLACLCKVVTFKAVLSSWSILLLSLRPGIGYLRPGSAICQELISVELTVHTVYVV